MDLLRTKDIRATYPVLEVMAANPNYSNAVVSSKFRLLIYKLLTICLYLLLNIKIILQMNHFTIGVSDRFHHRFTHRWVRVNCF